MTGPSTPRLPQTMKDYSLKSGERYSTLDLNLIGGDHLWRYEYAASRIGESTQRLFGADVFCGSGYGAALLAQRTNATILAIDGSAEAIDNANRKIHDPAILFAAKLFPFELPESSFDFITSMESIEHVKDHETFFWVLTKALKPGGRLFISMPNEDVMPYKGYVWHYRHFVPSEVRELAHRFELEEIAAFSTSCAAYKDGKTCLFYPYQIDNRRPLDLEAGDTLFFEFKKR